MSLLKKLFGKPQPTPPPLPPEFAEALDASRHYLNSFTQLHQSGWKLGQHRTHHLDQKAGVLRFDFADGTVVECAFQAIGSFSAVDNTWAWAWANPSIGEALTADARAAREYGAAQDIALLTTPQWPADLEWAWSMTAFAAAGAKAEGAYCLMHGPLHMFVTFRDVKVTPPGA
jgi:hypothetical protein